MTIKLHVPTVKNMPILSQLYNDDNFFNQDTFNNDTQSHKISLGNSTDDFSY